MNTPKKQTSANGRFSPRTPTSISSSSSTPATPSSASSSGPRTPSSGSSSERRITLYRAPDIHPSPSSQLVIRSKDLDVKPKIKTEMGPPPSPSPHKRARSALTVRARAAPYRRPSVSANSQPGPAGVHSRRNIIRHGSEVPSEFSLASDAEFGLGHSSSPSRRQTLNRASGGENGLGDAANSVSVPPSAAIPPIPGQVATVLDRFQTATDSLPKDALIDLESDDSPSTQPSAIELVSSHVFAIKTSDITGVARKYGVTLLETDICRLVGEYHNWIDLTILASSDGFQKATAENQVFLSVSEATLKIVANRRALWYADISGQVRNKAAIFKNRKLALVDAMSVIKALGQLAECEDRERIVAGVKAVYPSATAAQVVAAVDTMTTLVREYLVLGYA